jgi:hypothetical protein
MPRCIRGISWRTLKKKKKVIVNLLLRNPSSQYLDKHVCHLEEDSGMSTANYFFSLCWSILKYPVLSNNNCTWCCGPWEWGYWTVLNCALLRTVPKKILTLIGPLIFPFDIHNNFVALLCIRALALIFCFVVIPYSCMLLPIVLVNFNINGITSYVICSCNVQQNWKYHACSLWFFGSYPFSLYVPKSHFRCTVSILYIHNNNFQLVAQSVFIHSLNTR